VSDSLFWQGLTLSVLGMSLTFAGLGLLILAMIVLERLFRTRRLIPDKPASPEKPVASTLARDTEDEEIAAAIAVALAHFRSLDICQSGLGTALEAGPGAWWNSGLIQQNTLGAQPAPRALPQSQAAPTQGRKQR
jgi:sodium pump decarboxylase gamma subunit